MLKNRLENVEETLYLKSEAILFADIDNDQYPGTIELFAVKALDVTAKIVGAIRKF